MRQVLQSVTEVYCKVRKVLQIVTEVCYEVYQVLKIASGIKKCERLLLQSASGITKCDNYYIVRRNMRSSKLSLESILNPNCFSQSLYLIIELSMGQSIKYVRG